MIKGKNQHVMPDETGWCVVDEASQQVVWHFNTQEEAIAHASRQAASGEGDVLIHTVASPTSSLSTVALPQRELLPNTAHVPSASGQAQCSDCSSDYDPLLGFDEYYFEL